MISEASRSYLIKVQVLSSIVKDDNLYYETVYMYLNIINKGFCLRKEQINYCETVLSLSVKYIPFK